MCDYVNMWYVVGEFHMPAYFVYSFFLYTKSQTIITRINNKWKKKHCVDHLMYTWATSTHNPCSLNANSETRFSSVGGQHVPPHPFAERRLHCGGMRTRKSISMSLDMSFPFACFCVYTLLPCAFSVCVYFRHTTNTRNTKSGRQRRRRQRHVVDSVRSLFDSITPTRMSPTQTHTHTQSPFFVNSVFLFRYILCWMSSHFSKRISIWTCLR